ncbi:MAG: cytochrome c biogenesis heme-transporting ATPase CcmA [Betaproteobacteria bacterium]
MPTPAMFAAQDLAARRGNVVLWQGIAFALGEGAALVVKGANGSGKTTLLRILAGLTHAEHGTISWRGTAVSAFAQSMRDDLIYIGHAPALKDEMTAQENLASLVSLAGDDVAAQRVAVALAAVRLAAQADLPARVLSHGQRRRVHLALLAMSTRMLWILDEPATALDADGLAWLESALAAHLARGGVAVLATHAAIDVGTARFTEIAL